MDVLQHYQDNKEKYVKISEQLDDINQEFLEAEKEKQRRMLLDSYTFSVLSVQTPVDLHEEAFKDIKTGAELESAMRSINYWKNKVSYMRETEVKFEEIDAAIRLLETGRLDKAHRLIADEFKGVSTVKAAFTMAMLGFKEKACIDTNVLTALGMDREDMYNGVVVEKYNKFVDSSFNSISEKLQRETDSNFMNQWVIFDAVRGEVSDHQVFFDYVGQQVHN